MSERTAQNWDAQNQVALRRLMLTVEANSQSLELLIAVCDDRNLQAKVIEQYETELREKGIEPFRVRLNPKEPSLRRSVAALVDTEPGLRSGEPAVVTVLNAEALLGVTLGEEKSEQDRFFFSLQWQREALLRFGFAVVLWVPEGIATRSGQQAPDFWSWRGGVFEFKADEGLGKVVGSLSSRIVAFDDKRDQQAGRSVERLLLQIRELEETSPESALLITLYNDLGEVYKGCYAYGEALVWYEKALALAEKKGSLDGQARSLLNIGDALRFSGRPADSIRYYQQSLEITKEIGDRNGEAASLGSLGIANSYLSQYQQAIDFHQQSLEIKREIGDHNGAAASLGNLGIAHKNLGQYQQAIDSYQQSLEINRETGNRKGEANALGGLGNAYYALNQYWRAIDFYQQWLEIALEIDDYKGEATSLGGLGNAHHALEQYQRAIDFHQRSLKIKRKIGDCQGEASSLGGLGNAYYSLNEYQQAIDLYKQWLEIALEIGDRQGEASSLGNLGSAYYSLGQPQRALNFYQRSLKVEQAIGNRNGEAKAQFNIGLVLLKLKQKEAARSAFQAAQKLYADMGFSKNIEECDTQLQVIEESGQNSDESL